MSDQQDNKKSATTDFPQDTIEYPTFDEKSGSSAEPVKSDMQDRIINAKHNAALAMIPREKIKLQNQN